jgi:hypothetical protein
MSHWIKSSRDGRIEKTVEDSFSKDTYLHWNTSSEYIAGEDLHALKILHYTRQICKTILGLRKKKKNYYITPPSTMLSHKMGSH